MDIYGYMYIYIYMFVICLYIYKVIRQKNLKASKRFDQSFRTCLF